MDLTVEVNALKDLLPNASQIVILLPETASRDAIAAGLSLYLSLSQLNKTVTIAYPKQPIVGLSRLVGLNKLSQKLGSRNFVISLDYTEGSIEKVSYNIEGNKFNLVIEPRGDKTTFSEKNVSYSHSGMSADLIVTVETATLQGLGKFYSENQALFTDKTVVNIDNRTANTQYGKVNIVRPAASVSELIAHLIQQLELPFDADIASNLYDGLVSGARNFSHPNVTADTYEVAAFLLRSGARKPEVFMPHEEMPEGEFATPGFGETQKTPSDWLKPKIFTGKTGGSVL